MAFIDTLKSSGIIDSIAGFFARLGVRPGPRGGMPKNVPPSINREIAKEIYKKIPGTTPSQKQVIRDVIEEARQQHNAARRLYRQQNNPNVNNGAKKSPGSGSGAGQTYTITVIIYEEVDGFENSYMARFEGVESTRNAAIMRRIDRMRSDTQYVAEGDYRSSRYEEPDEESEFLRYEIVSIKPE